MRNPAQIGKGTIGQIPSSLPEQKELPSMQRVQRGNEPGEESANRDIQQSPKANSAMISDCKEDENTTIRLEDDREDESRAAEVQGVGTSLKVTIQRSSESRAFSTTPEESAAGASHDGETEKRKLTVRLICHICNVTCPDWKAFRMHMVSLDHQHRIMEIQQAGNTPLATLLPQSQESLQGINRARKMGHQRWCPNCQCHFSGDVIEHRRTTKHKLAKVSSRPFCTLCERHFRTPRKFVEHMNSPEHKRRVEEVRNEGDPEVMEELITVDAVGCFEGEDDYEEERNEDVPTVEKQPAHKEIIPEETIKCVVYDPETQYGTNFVVPVAGFLCQLCNKFYQFESTALETHCRSFMHFQNLQKYNAQKTQKELPHDKDYESDVSCSSPMLDTREPELIAGCSKISDGTRSDPNISRVHHSKKRKRSKRPRKSMTSNLKNIVAPQNFSEVVCTSHFGSGCNQESYNQESRAPGESIDKKNKL
ncbi:cdkn1a interacting zinc finger protein 1b [Misgurnus anguillicaudatus]|uniref:cdkn1a interacting zinc finger protein 1b n=1 Tax=Misgurnus anguillicaudatus TaxID=75329 RepID=UPI003CCF2CE4